MITHKRKQPQLSPILILIAGLLLTACSTFSTQPDNASVEQNGTEVLVETAVSDTTTSESVAVDATASLDNSTNTNSQLADSADTETAEEDAIRPTGWTEDTHSNDVDPNYAVVFPQDQVNSITITIPPENWEAMIANMTELYGEPSGVVGAVGGGGRPAGGGGDRPAGGGGGNRPAGGRGGDQFGGGGGQVNLGLEENPDYVTATIEFEGNEWTHVGIRFKGNSTLRNAWNSGSPELPFKLDFDEFEDEFPEIDDQRFYGFKQLSISSPSTDASYVRAATAYNAMQNAGLVAPETAWYELFVDYGDGPVSFGLYTFVEVVDDSVIQTAFGDDDGNIYEGDGTGSSLAAGTFDQLADSFQKENNDEADYSDLEALFNTLHAETRLTAPDQWRSDMEEIFDVDTFLHWLAVNSVMVNWDTYGQAAHNFYLYHDPETDLLTWIGWDYNEALQFRRGNATLSLAETTDAWPLIRYLLDQPVYYEQYVAYVAEVEAGALDAETLAAQLSAWETMLTPYVPDSAAFSAQIETITRFVQDRHNAVELFLAETGN